ncbi:hypothetical protein ACFWZZ_10515 [[Kitasatospora] papulosa]|uniref:hypothetical protein n=1 Tax=[Kitasatospora] papulosa TaxID=1464011 RepID=UPI0036CD45DC
MALTADEVAARAHNAAIAIDDDYDVPGGQLYEWPAGSEEVILTRITDTLAAYPHLVTDLGYAWTKDRSAYRTYNDAMFQWNVLELLGDVDPDHPNLNGVKPVAARQAINRDFISYAQPGRELDFIFIGRGFMDVLKYFLEMTLDIMDLAPGAHEGSAWGPASLEDIRKHHNRDVGDIVNAFLKQAIKVIRGEFPDRHSPIMDRLVAVPNLMWTTYDAVESFVVAHELGHLLERHDVRDATAGKEVSADKVAISLQLARHGTQKKMYGTSLIATMAVSLGGPAFYLLGNLYYLISSLDAWIRHRSIKPHIETFASLKFRWFHYRKYLLDLGSPTLISPHVVGLSRMVNLCMEGVLANSMGFNLKVFGKPEPFLDEEFRNMVWGDWLDDDIAIPGAPSTE